MKSWVGDVENGYSWKGNEEWDKLETFVNG